MWNIWDQVLSVIIDAINTVVLAFLPPGTTQEHINNALLFGQGLLGGTVIVLQFTRLTLEAFDWKIPLIAFTWILVMLGIAFAVSILEFIKSLINIVVNVVAILAKFFI